MNELTVMGVIEINRKRQTGKAILWLLGALVSAFILIYGFLHGKLYLLVVIFTIGFCLNAFNSSRGGRMVKTLPLSFFIDPWWLQIQMPQAELYKGKYVDQLYRIMRGNLGQVAIDGTQLVSVQAGQLEHYVFDGGVTIFQKTVPYGEVSFKLGPAESAKLKEFLRQAEILMQYYPGTMQASGTALAGSA